MTDNATIGAAYRILGYFENYPLDHVLPRNDLLRRFENDGGRSLTSWSAYSRQSTGVA